ncbi:MAG: IS30 family transposase [Aestuariivita sp.]|nr:IS30 family transposase [Aestuariivita sp.]MCY4201930.1 IS30 family transposase [Aestuariivita sp.]MCY4288816.1 IS30 family transposase [Aestuariivita sp.]MCY4345263.1 IS30 family transposase [Aestuariivita sp.]
MASSRYFFGEQVSVLCSDQARSCRCEDFWQHLRRRGKTPKGALVTVAGRASKLVLLCRVEPTPAASVCGVRIAMLNPYTVRTLPADNGKEFAYHTEFTKALGAPMYFAEPDASWRRGRNEQTDGLLRPYFPKAIMALTCVLRATRRLRGLWVD